MLPVYQPCGRMDHKPAQGRSTQVCCVSMCGSMNHKPSQRHSAQVCGVSMCGSINHKAAQRHSTKVCSVWKYGQHPHASCEQPVKACWSIWMLQASTMEAIHDQGPMAKASSSLTGSYTWRASCGSSEQPEWVDRRESADHTGESSNPSTIGSYDQDIRNGVSMRELPIGMGY